MSDIARYRYRVVSVELIADAPGFADLEEAIGSATFRTCSDNKTRVVVQVMSEVCSKAEPVIFARFGEPLERG